MSENGGDAKLSTKGVKMARKNCIHDDLDIQLHHQAFDDSNIHYLEIKVVCKSCGKPMIFRGCPLGMTPAHPTMALGGEEIRIPFLGEGEELAGNAIGFVGGRVF